MGTMNPTVPQSIDREKHFSSNCIYISSRQLFSNAYPVTNSFCMWLISFISICSRCINQFQWALEPDVWMGISCRIGVRNVSEAHKKINALDRTWTIFRAGLRMRWTQVATSGGRSPRSRGPTLQVPQLPCGHWQWQWFPVRSHKISLKSREISQKAHKFSFVSVRTCHHYCFVGKEGFIRGSRGRQHFTVSPQVVNMGHDIIK